MFFTSLFPNGSTDGTKATTLVKVDHSIRRHKNDGIDFMTCKEYSNRINSSVTGYCRKRITVCETNGLFERLIYRYTTALPSHWEQHREYYRAARACAHNDTCAPLPALLDARKFHERTTHTNQERSNGKKHAVKAGRQSSSYSHNDPLQ
jgi:hypothetical protein